MTQNSISSWKYSSACAFAAMALAGCQPDAPQNQPTAQPAAPTTGVDAADPSATDVTRDFALANFTSIEQNGVDDVTVRQGAAFSVQAKGRQQDLDGLDLRVEAGKLIIARKAGSASGAGREDVDIDVTLPMLGAVTLRGAGDVDVDAMAGDVVSAEVIGAGELKISRLTAKTAKLSIIGAGNLDVDSGEIDKGEYRITGAGDLDVEKLVAKDLTITSSGAGSVKGHASKTAKINLLGTGDVEIKGGATCQMSKQGAGNIRC